jgi:hypothetical protein
MGSPIIHYLDTLGRAGSLMDSRHHRLRQQPGVLLKNLIVGIVDFDSAVMVSRRVDFQRSFRPERG